MPLTQLPFWLVFTAEVYISLCLFCCLYIIFDQQRRPAPMMRIMLWVWPITALWAGPLGLWAYRGRKQHADMDGAAAMHNSMEHGHMTMDMPGHDMHAMDMPMSGPRHPHWKSVMAGTLHCGAGCTLADMLGPWLFRLIPFVLFGSAVFGEWALEYVLALLTGVVFQYAGLASMTKERGPALWWRAFKVDVLSLTAWQVGMYAWMALVVFCLLGPLSPTQPVFWFMMQIAMLCGFMTAYPMNWLLIRLGIKEAM